MRKTIQRRRERMCQDLHKAERTIWARIETAKTKGGGKNSERENQK